ncbi:hypothetical protein GCM10010840_34410 [Deinococcus aerolatus]|uniref:Uncharacterized protein n=1 Tax=Deinococcus aerolatus TaxID=522487 RepID=A0ABQ2GGJ9_9DEIO|nr:hypothetical protein GCM10010840_34410 [Deinococcus aerolatus]
MSRGTLQRVLTENRHAGVEVAGEFGPLKIGGVWHGHLPRTPPCIVPVRNPTHVREFAVQHSLNVDLSGTEGSAYYRGGSAP